MPKNIIVLGMARSGTSLTASIFANHGYYVDEAESIVKKNHTNPKGLWESTKLLKQNEDILRKTGFARDNTWRYDEITPEQIVALSSIEPDDEHRSFLRAFDEHRPWVWKDPRLCYTLGTWWPILDQEQTLVILVKRDPDAIFNSYVRIGWREDTATDREATYERTRQHIEHAEKLITDLGIPAITIQYEDFAKAPQTVADKINAASGNSIQPDELGYDNRFNHHNAKGRFTGKIDRVANLMPRSIVKLAKAIIPRRLLKRLYPERYE